MRVFRYVIIRILITKGKKLNKEHENIEMRMAVMVSKRSLTFPVFFIRFCLYSVLLSTYISESEMQSHIFSSLPSA